MSSKDFSDVLDIIIQKDSRYEKGAYYFLRHALDFTIKKGKEGKGVKKGETGKKGEVGKKGEPGGHISGQQLLEGIREYALEQYGPMTLTLFSEWGIKQCSDFGEIVFNLVDYGVLGKTEDDSRADFADGYNFHDAFELPFLATKKKE
jgi:uncharacterized repeat protein (TIGR04138 family)